jgi:hypothetical protein
MQGFHCELKNVADRQHAQLKLIYDESYKIQCQAQVIESVKLNQADMGCIIERVAWKVEQG